MQDDKSTDNVRQMVETALTEIRTEKENLKQSMEMGMQTMMEQMRNHLDSEMRKINNTNVILQSQTTKYSQVDEYMEKKRIDK